MICKQCFKIVGSVMYSDDSDVIVSSREPWTYQRTTGCPHTPAMTNASVASWFTNSWPGFKDVWFVHLVLHCPTLKSLCKSRGQWPVESFPHRRVQVQYPEEPKDVKMRDLHTANHGNVSAESARCECDPSARKKYPPISRTKVGSGKLRYQFIEVSMQATWTGLGPGGAAGVS